MTGKIIRLPPDPHRETQLLLPWYAAGKLDSADRAKVEAHLSGCPRCRSELAVEQRLEKEVADLTVDADLGWAAMRRKIEASDAPKPGGVGLGALARRASVQWLGWGMAASFGILLVWNAYQSRPPATAAYHTLSAAPATASGNVIVVFRPQATESAILTSLNASQARVVDGPTGAGAYVLSVPPPLREAALKNLRGRREVVMAEPLAMAGQP